MKNMNIASIKLKDGGLKGMVIAYAQPDKKDGREFTDILKHTKKAPIHTELEDAIKTLKGPLLDLCDYPLANRELDLQDTEITGVEYGDKGFIITGTKDVCDGKKSINLKSPLITSEVDYSGAQEITQTIDGIYDEVKLYASGEKVFSDDQLIMAFNKDNEEFDVDSFSKLSKEEKRDIATSTLEDMGCIVLNPEDGAAPEEEAPIEAVIEEAKPQAPAPKMEVVKETPKKKAEKAPKRHAAEMIEDGDTFSIIAAPKPESPATRKVAGI